jgi:hypothetical protein
VDSETIKALKENEVPFGLMDDDMQAKAKKIGFAEFKCYENSTSCVWGTLSIFNEYNFSQELTYRLRPDYEPPEEKPEIVECEVVQHLVNEDYYVLGYRGTDKQIRPLSLVPDGLMVAGFKFKGVEQVINKPFGYSHNGVDILPFVQYEDLKSGKYMVHYATHVLFQRAK